MFAAISPAGVPVSISKSAKCNDQPSRRAASIRPAPSTTDLLKRSIFATSNPAAFPSRTALSAAKAPGRPLIVFALIPSSRNSSTIVSPLRSAYAHAVALWASMPRPDAACSEVDTRRLRVHDLRHTYASLSRRAGADLRLLQKAMGHASITVTAHTYADLFDDELDNIAAALDSLDDLSRTT
jgi:Phage integrase family